MENERSAETDAGCQFQNSRPLHAVYYLLAQMPALLPFQVERWKILSELFQWSIWKERILFSDKLR